jgi:hypothetical protein
MDTQATAVVETTEVVAPKPQPKKTVTKKAKTAKTKKAVKASKPKKTTKAKTKAAIKLRPDGLRQGSAGGLLVDAVCRKSGLTHQEACKIVGWKQCLPFLVKSCEQAGVKLKKEKQEDGTVRYFGSKPARR